MNRDFWRGRKVFLTGHTGFKGSWLSLWLADMGARVTGYALRPPTQPNLYELAGIADKVRTVTADIPVKLRIDMEDRGGRIELLLPYATLEPIRKMLLQQFMGEKFGRDNIWESHLATELWTTQLDVRAVLDEQQLPLRQVLELKVGDTLMLNSTPDSQVELRAGAIPLTRGRMGRRNHHIAVRVDGPLSPHAKKAISRFK